MSDLKTPVSTTVKYKDGSETVISYNELGEKISEVSSASEVKNDTVEETVETPEEVSAEEIPEGAVETPAESVEETA